MTYTPQNRRTPGHPAGESKKLSLRVNFDRRLKLEFYGSRLTSDGGFLVYRELDDALGLSEVAKTVFQDSRTGKNGWHCMAGQFRQSVFGRLGGYDDVNDADRLGRDPACGGSSAAMPSPNRPRPPARWDASRRSYWPATITLPR